MDFSNKVAAEALAILLGGVSGGLISALVVGLTWWRSARGETARQLLSDALAIQSEPEAWILEGGSRETHLSTVAGVPILVSGGPGLFQGLWLRRVEVRVMLDSALWNAPSKTFYGFLEGRRAWIVRDALLDEGTRHTEVDSRPGLLSSRAVEGLVAWVQSVESARSSWMLSRQGLRMLSPLLLALAADDKITVLGSRLPESTKSFLICTRREYLESSSD